MTAHRRDQILQPGQTVETLHLGGDYVLAGDAKDGVEQNGPWTALQSGAISRFGLQVAALSKANLAAAVTYSLTWNLQDASDISGTGAADFGTAKTITVIGTGAVTDELTVDKVQQDMAGHRGFVRIQYTLTLSSGSVDTVVVSFSGTVSEEVGPVA